MFKFFKKKNVTVERLETIFPTAKDMLEKSAEKWPTKSDAEILKEIEEAAIKGKRTISCFKSHISERIVQELEQQGYSVDISALDKEPYFKVSW